MSFVASAWFIGLMVAVAVIIIVLIIVCIIIRNKGQKYHVHEKEKLKGTNEPVDDEDFDVSPPKTANMTLKSVPPVTDTNTVTAQDGHQVQAPGSVPGEGSETDSVGDFADMDPAKFNEDGSFIGQYGGLKTEYTPTSMSTFV